MVMEGKGLDPLVEGWQLLFKKEYVYYFYPHWPIDNFCKKKKTSSQRAKQRRETMTLQKSILRHLKKARYEIDKATQLYGSYRKYHELSTQLEQEINFLQNELKNPTVIYLDERDRPKKGAKEIPKKLALILLWAMEDTCATREQINQVKSFLMPKGDLQQWISKEGFPQLFSLQVNHSEHWARTLRQNLWRRLLADKKTIKKYEKKHLVAKEAWLEVMQYETIESIIAELKELNSWGSLDWCEYPQSWIRRMDEEEIEYGGKRTKRSFSSDNKNHI